MSDKESFLENKLTYLKTKIGFKNLKKEIEKRIGVEGDHGKYTGFVMSKTHSQEETNKEIDKDNTKVIEIFSDMLNVKNISTRLNFWKGNGFFSKTGDFTNPIEEFGGKTTHEILYWLIMDGSWYAFLWQLEEQRELEIGEIEKYEKIQNICRVIPPKTRYEVIKRQIWKCNVCGTNLKYKNTSSWEGEVAHIDHIYPFSKRENYKNGSENINETSNLQALCPKCNKSKSNKLCQ